MAGHRGTYVGLEDGPCPRCKGTGERTAFWTNQKKECDWCGGRGRREIYTLCGCDQCKNRETHTWQA
jgi:RecJ-like exonuclease